MNEFHRIAQRVKDNTPNGELDGRVDARGHPVYKCSEPDNVYCPICDTFFDPRSGVDAAHYLTGRRNG
jgi:hypothetical protein